jgi:hypothetical protein
MNQPLVKQSMSSSYLAPQMGQLLPGGRLEWKSPPVIICFFISFIASYAMIYNQSTPLDLPPLAG